MRLSFFFAEIHNHGEHLIQTTGRWGNDDVFKLEKIRSVKGTTSEHCKRLHDLVLDGITSHAEQAAENAVAPSRFALNARSHGSDVVVEVSAANCENGQHAS